MWTVLLHKDVQDFFWQKQKFCYIFQGFTRTISQRICPPLRFTQGGLARALRAPTMSAFVVSYWPLGQRIAMRACVNFCRTRHENVQFGLLEAPLNECAKTNSSGWNHSVGWLQGGVPRVSNIIRTVHIGTKSITHDQQAFNHTLLPIWRGMLADVWLRIGLKYPMWTAHYQAAKYMVIHVACYSAGRDKSEEY
jgi:hypothetical protein